MSRNKLSAPLPLGVAPSHGNARRAASPNERLYAERNALQAHIAVWKARNEGSGRRDVTDEFEARDAAMLATCEELIAELEARANCS